MIPLNDRLSCLRRSEIRVYTNLAKQVDDCVMLTIGEPDFDTPEAIKEAAWAALRDNRTHYAPNLGLESLRNAAAAFETKRGLACAPSQVLVTVGATGALFTALLGILNPGEEVIIPAPAFSLYETITTIAGGKPVPLDISKHNFQLTKEALSSVISEKTKAIVLNSPNNPTGAVLSRESLAAVKEAVLGKPIFLICDNVYAALAEDTCPDLSVDEDLREQVLLCQSFSKPYAMTGWRVGYLVGPEDVIGKLLLLSAAQIASVPTFLQEACLTALQTDVADMAADYNRRRNYVNQKLRAMGLSFPEPKGAFYAFPDISHLGLSDEEFCTRMILEAGVAAVPGSCFGCPGHIRISCCCSDSQLALGLDRMEAFINKLSQGG